MRKACPLSRMVLPGNFERNEHVIAVKAGDGNIVYVFRDALADWLCKIGVEPSTISQLRHIRPGEIFEGIEKLVEQTIAHIEEIAARIAEKSKKAVAVVAAEVRSLLERLIRTLSLNVSLTST